MHGLYWREPSALGESTRAAGSGKQKQMPPWNASCLLLGLQAASRKTPVDVCLPQTPGGGWSRDSRFLLCTGLHWLLLWLHRHLCKLNTIKWDGKAGFLIALSDRLKGEKLKKGMCKGKKNAYLLLSLGLSTSVISEPQRCTDQTLNRHEAHQSTRLWRKCNFSSPKHYSCTLRNKP